MDEERIARETGQGMAEDLAAMVAANARLLQSVPRCEKCGRYPIDHRAGVCIYPPASDIATIPNRQETL